jgi:hypothetical protein
VSCTFPTLGIARSQVDELAYPLRDQIADGAVQERAVGLDDLLDVVATSGVVSHRVSPHCYTG